MSKLKNLLKISVFFILLLLSTLIISSDSPNLYTINDFYSIQKNTLKIYKPVQQLIDVTNELNITSKQLVTVNIPEIIETYDKICDGKPAPEIFLENEEKNMKYCVIRYTEKKPLLATKSITRKLEINPEFPQPKQFDYMKLINDSYFIDITEQVKCLKDSYDEEGKIIGQIESLCPETHKEIRYRNRWVLLDNPSPILDIPYNSLIIFVKNSASDTLDVDLIAEYDGAKFTTKK